MATAGWADRIVEEVLSFSDQVLPPSVDSDTTSCNCPRVAPAGRGGDNRQDTWKRTTSSSINVHRLLAPAKGATTTTTCLPTALRLAASLKSALAVERRGCGRWPSATMRTAPRLTAMLQRAGRRWLHSRRAGGGS